MPYKRKPLWVDKQIIIQVKILNGLHQPTTTFKNTWCTERMLLKIKVIFYGRNQPKERNLLKSFIFNWFDVNWWTCFVEYILPILYFDVTERTDRMLVFFWLFSVSISILFYECKQRHKNRFMTGRISVYQIRMLCPLVPSLHLFPLYLYCFATTICC